MEPAPVQQARPAGGHIVTSIAAYVGGALMALLISVGGDMVSAEMRARLDMIPPLIIRIAALRAPRAMREDLRQEWTDEVVAIMHDRGRDRLPITRLIVGIRASLGWLYSARRVAVERGIVAEMMPGMIIFGLAIAGMNAASALPGGSTGSLWLTTSLAVSGGGLSAVYLSMRILRESTRLWPRLTYCALTAAAVGAIAIVVGLPIAGLVAATIAIVGIIVPRVRRVV